MEHSNTWSTGIKPHTCQHPDNLCHCTKNSEQVVIYRIYREEDCRGGYLSRVQSGANWDNSPNYTLTPIFDKWSDTRHGRGPEFLQTMQTRTRTHGHAWGAADTVPWGDIITLLVIHTLHSWPQCPEGDIRPEAILSRAFGTSRTTIHHQVTLYKGPESSDLDF